METNITAKEANPKRERKSTPEIKTDTKTISYQLFKEGKSLAEIARERNMAIVTVEGHLSAFVETRQIDINILVSEEKQLLIKEAAKIHGRENFKLLKDNLPETISYGEIRLVLASEKAKN